MELGTGGLFSMFGNILDLELNSPPFLDFSTDLMLPKFGRIYREKIESVLVNRLIPLLWPLLLELEALE